MNMKTSHEWWQEVKQDDELIIHWLKNQYHGEKKAAGLIRKFRDQHCPRESKWWWTLNIIETQEHKHARWIGELLLTRGVTPKILDKEERYWDQTLGTIKSFASGAAIAAHVERMSLMKLQVIVDDPDTPADIHDVFARILREEVFHDQAFSAMAGSKALQAAEANHKIGMAALGLISDE